MQLLERDDPLQHLDGLRAAAARGRGACAVVLGEAGIGKTSLVREFVRRATPAVDVLWGGCEALFLPRPLGPIVDMAPALPPALARSVHAGQNYNDLFPALLAHLRDGRRPRVVVIDDAHWADEATLDCLTYLGRRIDTTFALLVVTARSDEIGGDHPLVRVLGNLPAVSTQRIELAPLSPSAVGQLALAAGRDAAELLARTGGNPFFVTETLAATRGIPGSVRDAVLARVARLGAAARRVIDVVAVEPARIERALVTACLADRADDAAPAETSACDAAIREAIAAGVLHEDGRWLAFRHEIARLCFESALPASEAIGWHAAVLQRLQGRCDPHALARQVHHARGAGRTDLVARLAPRAAEQAAKLGAHRNAAALYRLALAAAEQAGVEQVEALHAGSFPAPAGDTASGVPTRSPAEQAALLEAAANELQLTSALPEAIEVRERALAMRRRLDDRVGIAANQCALGALYRQAGGDLAEYARRAQEAVDVLDHAVDPGIDSAVDPDLPRAASARACATMSHVLCLQSHYDAAVAWGERAVALAEASGDAAARVYALQRHGSARICRARDPAALEQVASALALAIEYRYDDLAADLFVTLQTLALIHHDHEYALDVGARGIAFCAARDLDPFVAGLLSRRAHSLLQLGRWAEGAREYAKCLAVPSVPAISRDSARHALHLQAMRRGARAVGTDAYTGAVAYWRRVHGRIDEQRIGFRPPAIAAACAEVAWLRGDLDAAIDVARRGLDAALPSRDGRLAGPLYVWLRRCGSTVPEHTFDMPEASMRELAGDSKGAAAAWQRSSNPYEQALALAFGDKDDQLAALGLFETLGAARPARLVRARLQALGERAIPQGPRRRTLADTHGLTPRERQVYELLQQRLSNAAIAARMHRSERTVENHVASVLAKLGVRSRSDVSAP